MSMVITGLGSAVPELRIPQAVAYDVAQHFCCDSDDHRQAMKLIYEGAGVRERGTVALFEPIQEGEAASGFFKPRNDPDDLGPSTAHRMMRYEEFALDLAVQSCENAIANADQDLSEITHLVTASCTGFQAPGVDIGLIQRLGLSPATQRTNVGFMGCHGSFNAMRVAQAFVNADPNAVVLVCSVELCTLHHHYGWSTEKVIANALFADGSAAAICRRGSGENTPAHVKYRMVRNGSHIVPKSMNAMTWKIRDNGFEMTLSKKVPLLIEEHLRGWMTAFLAKEGLTIEGISGWAIHPGGPRILDACLTALSLPQEAVDPAREILSQYGNMSSATVLFLLERIRQLPVQGPVVALGFGPGLTIEAMLLNTDA